MAIDHPSHLLWLAAPCVHSHRTPPHTVSWVTRDSEPPKPSSKPFPLPEAPVCISEASLPSLHPASPQGARSTAPPDPAIEDHSLSPTAPWPKHWTALSESAGF